MKDNQEPKSAKREVDLTALPEELRGIAAEFPDFAEIIAGANYDTTEPEVIDPDPSMHYYRAASPDRWRNHPANVAAVGQLGYRVSEKKLRNPVDDCVLMETPKPLYELRMRKQTAQWQSELSAVNRRVTKGDAEKGLEVMESSKGPDNLPPGARILHGKPVRTE